MRNGPRDHSLVLGVLIAGLPCWLSGKESTCDAGSVGSIPGSGRTLEREMAAHSGIPAWEIPWTGKPSGLQPMGLQRVRHDLVMEHAHACCCYGAIVSNLLQSTDLGNAHVSKRRESRSPYYLFKFIINKLLLYSIGFTQALH